MLGLGVRFNVRVRVRVRVGVRVRLGCLQRDIGLASKEGSVPSFCHGSLDTC